MKNARYLVVAIVGQLLFTSGASADTTDNPYTRVDADGVPITNTQSQGRQLTQDEISAIRKAQQHAAADKDWLVRSYEQQVKSHASANSSDDSSANYYYQLSTNKELAKLAGIPLIDGAEQGTVPVPLANRPASLRTATPAAPSANSLFFKPLITPLSAPDAAGLHGFYSSMLPTPILANDSPNQQPQQPALKSDEPSDPADIETPGMIAAEKDPLAQPDTQDLSLDVLPGESIEEAKKHQENENKLELSLPMDATQLHRAQAVQLAAPTPANAIQPTPVNATVTKVPIEDPNAPIPVSKTPQITPVRGPIARPFDILDR